MKINNIIQLSVEQKNLEGYNVFLERDTQSINNFMFSIDKNTEFLWNLYSNFLFYLRKDQINITNVDSSLNRKCEDVQLLIILGNLEIWRWFYEYRLREIREEKKYLLLANFDDLKSLRLGTFLRDVVFMLQKPICERSNSTLFSELWRQKFIVKENVNKSELNKDLCQKVAGG